MSRGTRPKKPLSTATNELLKQLQRKRGTRTLAKRFLIVCEDGKSAPNYLYALKRHLSLSATSIEVLGSDGRTQPIQVVRHAIERKNSVAKQDNGALKFDEVWCLIDGDYGHKINAARSSARSNGIKLAVSTKCFEYWILLHFEESAKPAKDCDEIVTRLRKSGYLPRYEKGNCDFSTIVEQMDVARERAQRLRKPRLKIQPEKHNPCSEVYLLINEILASK